MDELLEEIKVTIDNKYFSNCDIDYYLNHFNEEQKKEIYAEYLKKRKKTYVALLLWFFLGVFQVHMLYLKLFDRNHLFKLRIASYFLVLLLIGFAMLLIIWIYDGFMLYKYIKQSDNLMILTVMQKKIIEKY